MQPNRNAELVHLVPERQKFRAVERLAGDIGVDLHAERAELLDRAFRLGDAGIRRRETDLRHPAGEMILLLGAQFREAVVDDAAELSICAGVLANFFDRRLRIGEDLLIVLVAVDDLLAHVEVIERRKRAHALAHVPVVGGDLIEHVEEFFRKKVRVRVDAHEAFLPIAAGFLARAPRVAASTYATAPCPKRASTSGGIGCDLMRVGSSARANHPNARLEAFDRERAGLGQPMFDFEARSAAFDQRGLDRHFVTEPRRQAKARPGLDQWMSGEGVGLQVVDFVHAERALDENGRGRVEHLEIARIEDDPGGIAVAPFDADIADVGKHPGGRIHRGAMRSAASMRMTSPLM
jgi:hypothetical protein